MKVSRQIDPRKARAGEYPDIGEQLDSIVKGFSRIKDSGIDIGPEANALVDHCMSIKNKYKVKGGKQK